MDLTKIVNVFRCCILTWDFLPVVLPAFLIAGAIPVFIPPGVMLRYLGAGVARAKSYAVAAVTGLIAPMCSCNVVPVADSVYRQGAGLGPTMTFLFAGPAVNLVTMVWAFEVVGLKMGLWRALAVPVVGLLVGLIMAFLFRGEARRRAAPPPPESHPAAARWRPVPVGALFGLLLAILIFGNPGMPGAVKLPMLALLGVTFAVLIPRWFGRGDLGEWMRETGRFLRRVLPILVPAILAIAVLQFYALGPMLRYVRPYIGGNSARDTYLAAAAGSVLYFPMLTEVALVKALLKDGIIGVGPALALLINGPGVSLPGAILLWRLFGWKKMVVYEVLEMGLGGTVAYAFGSMYGDYVCPCQSLPAGTIMEQPSSLGAAAILAACMIIVWIQVVYRSRRAAQLSDEAPA